MKLLKATIFSFLTLFPILCVSKEVVFQQSVGLNIQLGIRDKEGKLNKYIATFVVTDSAGKAVEKSIEVEGENFGYVTFPEDFETWLIPGRYTWEGKVDGETVIKGSFEMDGSFILKIQPTN